MSFFMYHLDLSLCIEKMKIFFLGIYTPPFSLVLTFCMTPIFLFILLEAMKQLFIKAMLINYRK